MNCHILRTIYNLVFLPEVGQTAYLSRMSGNWEHMPVSISIMGPRCEHLTDPGIRWFCANRFFLSPDTDHCLTKLVQDMLKSTGLPLSVQVGKTPFEVAEIASQKL